MSAPRELSLKGKPCGDLVIGEIPAGDLLHLLVSENSDKDADGDCEQTSAMHLLSVADALRLRDFLAEWVSCRTPSRANDAEAGTP